MRLAFVFGTRPEVIKLAPVVWAARRQGHDVAVIATGQHREMLDQMLSQFEIEPAYDLGVMRPRQELTNLAGDLLRKVGVVLRRESPDVVLVQGDTTSALAGALAAFYSEVPVAHVEAGLRTRDRSNPFPEEANRRLIAPLASYHFCPTERGKGNLVREGIDEDCIHVVGNTVVDALLWARSRLATVSASRVDGTRRLLVTLHRRESQGPAMRSAVEAIAWLAEHHGVEVLFPMHKSPAVRDVVLPILRDRPNVRLTEPLDYFGLVAALDWCDLVLTDSGGIQEEAPSLGKPVLVARESTERPEAVEVGVARLVGTDGGRIRDEVIKLFADPDAYRQMARVQNPFGDGEAARRIVACLSEASIAQAA